MHMRSAIETVPVRTHAHSVTIFNDVCGLKSPSFPSCLSYASPRQRSVPEAG